MATSFSNEYHTNIDNKQLTSHNYPELPLLLSNAGEWGYEIDHETLRRWLIAAELWQRQRRRGPHRRWREPKRCFGELVQFDGSHHDWLGTGVRCCLMNMVDDATGRSLARLEEQETTVAAMQLLWSWIDRYGVPAAVYVDGKTVYVTDREATAEEQLAGEEPLTEFGKACQKLGIRIVLAHSAPAKGRVERKHGVYQDRFVKELALLGITTIAGANAVLEGGFVDGLNERFAREPLDPQDAHRAVPEGLDLAAVFVFEVTRTVANDWTIRYENRWYQITGPRGHLPRPRTKVTVQRRLDGSLHILRRGQALDFREVPMEARLRPKSEAPAALPGERSRPVTIEAAGARPPLAATLLAERPRRGHESSTSNAVRKESATTGCGPCRA